MNNVLSFEHNNYKFIIENYNGQYSIYFFYNGWGIGEVFAETQNRFIIGLDFEHTELLIMSNLFEYKKVNGKFYEFRFNNNAKLQLL